MDIIFIMRNKVKITKKDLKKILLKRADYELKEFGGTEIFPDINKKIPKEYTDLDKFVAEIILGFTPKPDKKVYLEKVENFPIEFELYTQRSQDGYHGGNAYSKVIAGEFKPINTVKFEDQYIYGHGYKGLLYPNNEGIAIVKKSSEWYGKDEYYVYYDKKGEKILEEKMERWNSRRKQIIEEIRKELETKIDELIQETDKKYGIENILDTINSVKYIYTDKDWDQSRFGSEECEITVYLNKNKVPIYLKIKYTFIENCYGDDVLVKEIEINNTRYRYEIVTYHNCEWFEMGYGGGNYLEEWDEVKESFTENKKLFWIVDVLISYRFARDAIRDIKLCYPEKGIDILDRHKSTKVILSPTTKIKFV